jgi:membrane-bound lytic murein transglycosylase B
MRALLLSLALAAPAGAAPCGGDFAAFRDAMAAEAVAAGLPAEAATGYLAGARQDAKVLKADRAQGVFRKTFLDFSQSLISKGRLSTAKAKSATLDALFSRAQTDFGVGRGILLAFWAFETDFGQIQGDFNTRDALLTLAHDCRRPEIFQPQVLAAIALHSRGDLPTDTTGAWAGEIGQVQMLPRDILERGQDGDGDGHVTLKTSSADAILSGAALLRHHGWRANEPWLTEVDRARRPGLVAERPAHRTADRKLGRAWRRRARGQPAARPARLADPAAGAQGRPFWPTPISACCFNGTRASPMS